MAMRLRYAHLWVLTLWVLTLWVVALWVVATPVHAQGPAPIADRVEDPLLPSGISELSVELNSPRAYLFKDEDGTDAAYYLGGFTLRHGGPGGHRLSAEEAVVWITTREWEGRRYKHLDILLWRNGEITEIGGTSTAGPALFVTLNTFGDVATHVDEYTLESASDRKVYREGNAIRQAIGGAELYPPEEATSLRVLDTTGLTGTQRTPKARPVLIFQAPTGEFKLDKVDGRDIVTIVGGKDGVYVARGDPQANAYLEIRAESVVIFLPKRPRESGSATAGQAADGAMPDLGGGTPSGAQRRDAARRQRSSGPFGDRDDVEGVYLEGDVQMTQGPFAIRASRLYYDLREERALILDAVAHTMLEKRGVPLYIRAAQIRQLSPNKFAADEAMLTTSEFHTPHYHIGARRVELINRTPLTPGGRAGAIRAGSYTIKDATLNIGGVPIAWWPMSKGNVDTSETALLGLRTGFSGRFGAEVETDWHTYNLLGLETPEGFSSTLSLDFFSERGPAIGVDVDYERDTYFGLVRTYLMADAGRDNLGRKRPRPSKHDVRARALIRHRHYLEDDWQLSLELSYIADATFLEEFYEREFENDKEQETLLFLKKQRANWAFTALLQTRILDFYTQTERLPDFAFHLAGEPLGDVATWFSENRAGIVRYRREEDRILRDVIDDLRVGRRFIDDSGSVFRADSRQEIDLPIDLGPLRLVPFTSVRASIWDDSPKDGGLFRGFATAGVRGSMYLWRVYPDAKSTLFDIDGVRHIIKPDITGWVSTSNEKAKDLFPFDETVEGIAETNGFALGIRQRWQTKRGPPDRRRTVDFLTLDVEMGFFGNNHSNTFTNGFTSYTRPENSLARNYVNSSLIWRINDRTALLSEMNYDVNDGEIDVFNLSLAVERTPRMSYLLGYRFISETNSNLLGFDLNYRLSEKHTIAFREQFDLQSGRTLDFTVAFIRKFPRWFGALSFELDDAEDDFGVSINFWPEGLPQASLGSRRFTGLADSTRLTND